MSIRQKLRVEIGTSRDTLARSVVLQCGAGAWLKGLASGDQRRPTKSGSALEVCYT